MRSCLLQALRLGLREPQRLLLAQHVAAGRAELGRDERAGASEHCGPGRLEAVVPADLHLHGQGEDAARLRLQGAVPRAAQGRAVRQGQRVGLRACGGARELGLAQPALRHWRHAPGKGHEELRGAQGPLGHDREAGLGRLARHLVREDGSAARCEQAQRRRLLRVEACGDDDPAPQWPAHRDAGCAAATPRFGLYLDSHRRAALRALVAPYSTLLLGCD
mmetsp:Transcript_50195/g.160696  ORF Transcript_50195/g.160696 Transcript_50195/m.160696 type:complete len:220 (+) Transcript_50195:149-808(+)